VTDVVDEGQLLGRIRAGDTAAFGDWAAGAERPLRLALRSFCEGVDVESVVQESLTRVWQVAPRFVPDGKPDALLRFAVRTARNCAVSELRRARPTADLDAHLAEIEAQGAVMPEPPDPLLRAAIERCQAQLPRQPAAALAQRLESGGGEPDALLAERLSMRLNTFLQNVTRARKLLRACLEKAGITQEGVPS
jgi:RNA polymerase sigma-70 factor (ECF subfamily)